MVLYELIKGITVLYMPNQAHNCTVWLIQYSYAVDYYLMNYTAHFFALILPRKVQYWFLKLMVGLYTEYSGNVQVLVSAPTHEHTTQHILIHIHVCTQMHMDPVNYIYELCVIRK